MNIIKIFNYLFGLTLLSLVTSCAVSNMGDNSSELVVTKTSLEESRLTYHSSGRNSLPLSSSIALPESLAKLSPTEIDNVIREGSNKNELKILRDFSFAAVKAKSWQEVDQLAQESIRKTIGSFASFHVHQMIATTMLNTYFLMLKPSLDVQKAVGFYMDVLIKHFST